MIHYYKINGNGNHFLVMDNRRGVWKGEELREIAIRDCNVKTSVGADGILVVEASKCADFKMRLFNCDGSEGEMCGNGARCIARYAYERGMVGKQMTFETLAGLMRAEIVGEDEVTIDMGRIQMKDLILDGTLDYGEKKIRYHFLTVGVPHCMIDCEENQIATREEMLKLARLVRNDTKVFPNGTNVNFVKVKGPQAIETVTYERGVEDFTDSCGTGSCASAIVTALLQGDASPIRVFNPGGINQVEFQFLENKKCCDLRLRGKVNVVAEIQMCIDQRQSS